MSAANPIHTGNNKGNTFVTADVGGYHVIKRFDNKSYSIGQYPDRSVAEQVQLKANQCNTKEDIRALQQIQSQVIGNTPQTSNTKKMIPGPGVNRVHNNHWQAKIEYNGDYFILGEGSDKAEITKRYNEGVACNSISEIMDMRVKHSVNGDGAFRDDKEWKNPFNEAAYKGWLNRNPTTVVKTASTVGTNWAPPVIVKEIAPVAPVAPVTTKPTDEDVRVVIARKKAEYTMQQKGLLAEIEKLGRLIIACDTLVNSLT